LNSIIDGNDNSYYGLSNIKGKVKAISSTFKRCEIDGIYADSAVTRLDSCIFENCWRYGIYSFGHPTGTYDSTLITNCTIQRTATPNPDSSQYGIYVGSNAKIRLANNLIRNCGQGGIRLSASIAKVYYDTIKNVSSAGILCENSASATIRNCVLDTIPTGIYTTGNTACYIRSNKLKHHSYGVRTWGRPNLGDTREAGHNNIEDCSIMFISKPQMTIPPETVYAQYNYYGPGTPNPNKFSPGVKYIPYSLTPWLKKHIIEDAPSTYFLNSNYPNPFNPQTAISFNIIEPAQTRVLIYNILGQKIKTLVNEYLSPGQYSYVWDGRNELGEEAASGVYLYRIESGTFAQTKKMTLMR
jgi:parallel beta-helix repeat protein